MDNMGGYDWKVGTVIFTANSKVVIFDPHQS